MLLLGQKGHGASEKGRALKNSGMSLCHNKSGYGKHLSFMTHLIALDKKGFFIKKIYIFLLFFSIQKSFCGYSLEASLQDASNGYPGYMF